MTTQTRLVDAVWSLDCPPAYSEQRNGHGTAEPEDDEDGFDTAPWPDGFEDPDLIEE